MPQSEASPIAGAQKHCKFVGNRPLHARNIFCTCREPIAGWKRIECAPWRLVAPSR